jgi:hypothetical protein
MAKSVSQRKRSSTIEGGPTPSHRLEYVPRETDVPTLYVNNIQVETSVWDVRLRLGETIETDRENNITRVREIANVRM